LIYLKILHGEVNAIDVTVRDPEITRPCCTSTDNNRVVFGTDSFSIDINSNVSIWNKGLGSIKSLVAQYEKKNETHNAFGCHEIDTTLDDRLVELHTKEKMRRDLNRIQLLLTLEYHT